MDVNKDHKKREAKPKVRELASKVASVESDPRLYAHLAVLPNPDVVLRKAGKDQEVYDAILYDAHVMGEVRSQYGALLKNEWRIIAGGDSAADKAALELCINRFKAPPSPGSSWSNFIWHQNMAIYKGYAGSEIVWKREGNHLVPDTIEDVPNRRLRFNPERELRLLTRSNPLRGEECAAYKWLLSRHMPSSDNPYGVATLSACFWPYTIKHNGVRWFTRLLERYGLPTPKGTYPAHWDDKQINELVQSLEKAIEDIVLAIPQGAEVELLELKVGAQAPHKELLDFCNKEMSKALTSQTLASEVTEAGSRSTAEVQKERQDDNSEADREMIQRTMQQICDWTTLLNFPGANPPLWQWYDERETTLQEVQTLTASSKLVPIGEKHIYERLQIPVPEKSERVVFLGQQGADPENTEGATFSSDRQASYFNLDELDDLQLLAEMGADAAQPSINRMLDRIREYAESVEDLDELEAGLADLFDEVDKSELLEALRNTRLIAHAKGASDIGE